MTKELIICVIIVVLIIVGDVITQNYTNDSVKEASESLYKLRDEIIKENVDSEQAKQKIENIYDDWNKRQEKLSYYIEHDELEKVKTDLTGVKGYIDVEEYSEAVPELDRTIFVLEHIKHKSMLNLENIF